jgi:hypothetical protein
MAVTRPGIRLLVNGMVVEKMRTVYLGQDWHGSSSRVSIAPPEAQDLQR